MVQAPMKDGETTSKKLPEQRRQDVLVKALPWLLSAVVARAAELLTDKTGSKVLAEVLATAAQVTHADFGNEALAKHRGAVEEALNTVAALFADEANHAAFGDVVGHHTLKRIIVQSKPDGHFATALLEVAKDGLPDLALERGAFVFAAILEKGDAATSAACKAAVEPHLAALAMGDKPGAKLLVKLVKGEETKPTKATKTPAKSAKTSAAKTPAAKTPKAAAKTPKTAVEKETKTPKGKLPGKAAAKSLAASAKKQKK
jgi:hypothetical protein